MVQDRTFTSGSYRCVGCYHVLFNYLREKSVPLTSQVLHVLKILAAHWLKIAVVKDYYLRPL